MNFLSHFYFERGTTDSDRILGTILPDVVKNAHKDWNFYPQKNEEKFTSNPIQHSLLDGWKRHLEVDLLFHSSDFFFAETAKLKQLLLPILGDSNVRPSFLAHIGVELLLDHLLVIKNKVGIGKFYDHLDQVNEHEVHLFLTNCGAADTTTFFAFFNSFKSSKYLLSYQKLENISYALQRICMRLWSHPFNEQTVTLLSDQLDIYKRLLEKNYEGIFEEIEGKLLKH